MAADTLLVEPSYNVSTPMSGQGAGFPDQRNIQGNGVTEVVSFAEAILPIFKP